MHILHWAAPLQAADKHTLDYNHGTESYNTVDIVGRKVPFPVVGCNRVVPL